MRRKATIISLAIVSVALVLAVGLTAWRNYIPSKIYRYERVDSIVNLSNPRELVGIKEYVFVCRVIETHDYNSERLFRDFPAIIDYYGGTFTECKIEVIKNIEGSLKENEITYFYKGGGCSVLKDSICLFQNDIMPVADSYYIFTGMAHPDGTMTGGGEYGTIMLEPWVNKNNIEDSAVYQYYVDAYNNQTGSFTDVKYLATIDTEFDDGNENARRYALEKEKRDIQKEYDEAVKKGNDKLK